jgi:hypothetical protein
MRARPFAVAGILAIVASCSDPFTEPAVTPPETPDVSGPLVDLMQRGVVLGGMTNLTTLERAHWADAYVWADKPTAASYQPSAGYAFNRMGGGISIARASSGDGVYNVRMKGLSSLLGSQSTVMATAYGSSTKACKSVTPRIVKDIVQVRCFDLQGARANSRFSLLVTRAYNDNAFASANRPTETDYAPSNASSWNPTGGAMRVYRDEVGLYRIWFEDLATLALGNFVPGFVNSGETFVQATGTNSSYCSTEKWTFPISGAIGDITFYVRCFTATGTPTDATFNVVWVYKSNNLAYNIGNQPTAASYTGSSINGFNQAGTTTITRAATGDYTVGFGGMNGTILDGGNVQVTAWGTSNTRCNVESWDGEQVHVLCFDPAGTLTDSQFTVLLGS